MINLDVIKTLNDASGEMRLDIKLEIEEGSFVTLYGKSGAGKTSVLRMLAGLMTPDAGNIKNGEVTWYNSQKSIHLPPQDRKVGFVFQDYALFPNMTVKENLSFAVSGNQDKSRVNELIEIIELGDLQNRKPQTLSGGQQQRVALARALVRTPDLLMLDEPLSALDNEIRAKLQSYILTVHKEYRLTTILISHDVSEILKMSDWMVVLDRGQVTRQGAPSEVFINKEVSGKFQFTGEVVGIERQDFIFIVSILIGKDLVKVVADESEAKSLAIGDKVLVASKAFNPVIKRLN